MNVELNVSEILDRMTQEIATLIRQVYIKDAEISALKAHIAMTAEVAVERPEVTE